MSKQEIRHPDKQVSTGAYSAGVLWSGIKVEIDAIARIPEGKR
ncbi:hypothetical protein [Paludibaculum fermentans]|nr:hypothetical protein [Paludibaculum fermentans]